MAKITWKHVKKYLCKKYKTDITDDDMVRMVFTYPDEGDRTQLVLIDHEQQESRLVVEVISRVGVIETSRLPEVLAQIGKRYFVALEKMGNIYYARVSLNMNYAPLEEVASTIEFVSRTADALEKEFVGGDEN